MYVRHRFPFIKGILLTWKVIFIIGIWSTLLTAAHVFGGYEWIRLPALPIGILGTAIAFYLGFKGNAGYGRLWEARKIWGGIVNTSRTWGTYVTTMIFPPNGVSSEKALLEEHQELIYRHIAWLTALRIQLLRPKSWEHREHWHNSLRKKYGTWDTSDEKLTKELQPYLTEAECTQILNKKNRATQLIHRQGQLLKRLLEAEQIDSFRHLQLMRVLEELYALQGKCERLKNFPLPRQYATANHWFVYIFITLLPLALLGSFHSSYGTTAWIWGTIPTSVMIGWVFYTWDLALEYSEIPFEGLINDIPMASLLRTIEIDLREILGETTLPPPIAVIDDEVLM